MFSTKTLWDVLQRTGPTFRPKGVASICVDTFPSAQPFVDKIYCWVDIVTVKVAVL